jgi:hypothetical protein
LLYIYTLNKLLDCQKVVQNLKMNLNLG